MIIKICNPRYCKSSCSWLLGILLLLFGISNLNASPLQYSTFFGGTNSDYLSDMVIDSTGNIYVTGVTYSNDFPVTPGAIDTTIGYYQEAAYVFKFNPDTNTLFYCTYLDGTSSETWGSAIALDTEGNPILGGTTFAEDFPLTSLAFSTVQQGGGDGFLVNLDSTGQLKYSTLFGGTATDNVAGIALDSVGNIVFAGYGNVPYTPGSWDTTGDDAYIAKMDSTLSSLIFSTGIGGGIQKFTNAMTVDREGNIYVTGEVTYVDIPGGTGTLDTTINGLTDAFVFKMNPSGSNLIYGGVFGGEDYDYGLGIAADSAGNAYVTGFSQSSTFATTPGAWMSDTIYGLNGFVAKINPTGTAVDYVTVMPAIGENIKVDETGNAYVTGETYNPNYPTTPGSFDRTFTSLYGGNAIILELNTTGSAPVYSSFLGGGGSYSAVYGDQGASIIVDSSSTVWVGGMTGSSNFPVTSNAYDTTLASSYYDLFLTHLSLLPVPEADFYASATVGLTPFFVQFFDASTVGAPVNSWFWDFGDGYTSTVQNPTHTYSTVGQFNVTLVATGTYGDGSITRSNYIRVYDTIPQFYGTPTVGQLPLVVQFYDTSSSGNPPVGWLWEFGDGSTSNLQNPSHTYTQSSVYNVTLTTIGSYGASSAIRYDYILAFDTIEQKIITSPGLYDFSIGTDSTYTPFTLLVVFMNGIDTVTISVMNEKHPNRPVNTFMSRWFKITSHGNITYAGLQMRYVGEDVTDAGVDEYQLKFCKYDGSSWSYFDPSVVYTYSYYHTAYLYYVNSFSDWTLGIPGSTTTDAPLWEFEP